VGGYLKCVSAIRGGIERKQKHLEPRMQPLTLVVESLEEEDEKEGLEDQVSLPPISVILEDRVED